MQDLDWLFKSLCLDYNQAFANRKSRLEYNPIKQHFTLRRNDTSDQFISTYANIMSAKLLCGTIGVKSIFVNEPRGLLNASLTLTFPSGRQTTVDASEITLLRCGLMAALAAEKFVKVNRNTKVGFIGNGKINQKTAQVFQELFGIEDICIRGSKQNRSKNYHRFKAMGFDQIEIDHWDSPELTRTCDIVISCTNTLSSADVISYKDLEGPSLFIAQDGGYIFGPSFREYTQSFTDHPEQLCPAWSDEFPYDEDKIPLYCLANRSRPGPISIYLYGIAFADVFVAAHGGFID